MKDEVVRRREVKFPALSSLKPRGRQCTPNLPNWGSATPLRNCLPRDVCKSPRLLLVCTSVPDYCVMRLECGELVWSPHPCPTATGAVDSASEIVREESTAAGKQHVKGRIRRDISGFSEQVCSLSRHLSVHTSRIVPAVRHDTINFLFSLGGCE